MTAHDPQPDSIDAQPLSDGTTTHDVEPASFQDELRVPLDDQERAGRRIRKALHACQCLSERSPGRDALWVTVQQEVCTTSPRMVRPFGSTKPFLVTEEQATDELLTAMTWLTAHEDQARRLPPLDLFVLLRGVATKSGTGSARAAQADSLHGITEVPSGCTVTWERIDEAGAA